MIPAVTVIAVGKLKEKFYLDASTEYIKRISRFCRINVIELPEKRLPEKASRAEIESALSSEAELIRSKVPTQAKIIVLAIEGGQLSSEAFAEKLENFSSRGIPAVCFVIGSSYGLDAAFKKECEKISFSPMTFPHHLARVMLLEQVYRACMLSNGSSYHK